MLCKVCQHRGLPGAGQIVWGSRNNWARAGKKLAEDHEIIRVGKTRGDFLVDLTDETSLRTLFERSGKVDAIITTTGTNVSAVNAGIEVFAMAAANKLSSLRINVVSPSVLTEALDKYSPFFPGFESVSANRVALAYGRIVKGIDNGKSLWCGSFANEVNYNALTPWQAPTNGACQDL